MIHVSGGPSHLKTKDELRKASSISDLRKKPSSAADGQQSPRDAGAARRFRISRSMLKNEPASNSVRLSKRSKHGPAIFVEHSRKKMAARRGEKEHVGKNAAPLPHGATHELHQETRELKPQASQTFKRPTVAAKKFDNTGDLVRSPLPPSLNQRQEADLSKIAAEMDAWVMREIGANLEAMQTESKSSQSPSRFRPKPPAQRYKERHPELAGTLQGKTAHNEMDIDVEVSAESSEDEDSDDWVVEEYIRIPAKLMSGDVAPTDIGVLILDGEDASALFYGPDHDEDDDYLEDDEDENGEKPLFTIPTQWHTLSTPPVRSCAKYNPIIAENHYTADYPEDEVDSDDEYGRQAYLYRTRNASDDEEFDNNGYESSDDMVLDDGGDDDVTMARIKAYMKRHPGS